MGGVDYLAVDGYIIDYRLELRTTSFRDLLISSIILLARNISIIIIKVIVYLQAMIIDCLYYNQSIALQLMSKVLPFKEYTEDVLRTFIQRLYKECRYVQTLKEWEIEELQKAIRKNLRHTAELFGSLVSLPSNTGMAQKKDLPQQVSIDLKEMKSMEQEARYNETILEDSISSCFNSLAFFQRSQAIFSTPSITPHLQIQQKQSKIEESSDSEDDYDAQLKLQNDTRAMANESAKIHLSGLYNSSSKPMNSKKTMRLINMPFLIAKASSHPEQFLIKNCHGSLPLGCVSILHNMLVKEKQRDEE